jgi:hypothetical protein
VLLGKKPITVPEAYMALIKLTVTGSCLILTNPIKAKQTLLKTGQSVNIFYKKQAI